MLWRVHSTRWGGTMGTWTLGGIWTQHHPGESWSRGASALICYEKFAATLHFYVMRNLQQFCAYYLWEILMGPFTEAYIQFVLFITVNYILHSPDLKCLICRKGIDNMDLGPSSPGTTTTLPYYTFSLQNTLQLEMGWLWVDDAWRFRTIQDLLLGYTMWSKKWAIAQLGLPS